jgi:uncharacterized protein (DUF58 family)
MGRSLLPVNAPITFLLLLFLLAPAAVLQGNNILFWLLAVLVTIVLVSLVGSALMLRGLEVKRHLPMHGSVGEPLVIGYAVHRRRRRLPAFGLFIEEELDASRHGGFAADRSRGWILHVGAGETVHGEGILVPDRRGRIEFTAFRIRTSFPFGLARRQRRFEQPQHTLIYPRVHQLQQRILSALTPQGPDGLRTTDHRGGGDDYFGIRQLRSGDSLRDIAWKLSAHRGDLLAIDRARPSPPRIRIVLDLSTPTDELQVGDDEPVTARDLEERAIALAASILKAATDRGLEVDLAVPGFEVPSLGFRGHAFHVHRVMTMLAGLDLDSARSAGAAGVPVMERTGLVVIRPDRVRPLRHRPDAWYLTARQLHEFIADPSSPDTGGSEHPDDEVAA